MKLLTFLTNETDKKRYAQIDLQAFSKMNQRKIEDLMDIIIAESRKYDEKITLGELGKMLKKANKI